MKRCILLMILVLSLGLAFAQTYLWEDFSSETFPPTGWTINGGSGNWSANDSRFARGEAPEMRFSWSPTFTGTSRVISPTVDTTGETSLKLEFRHCLDYYDETFTIGIATRSNNGAWNTVYHIVEVNADIQAHQRTINIANADVGSSTFQFCFFFTGNSYNIDYWYIDNIRLYKPWPNDLALMEVLSVNEAYAGVGYTPIVMTKNVGQNTLTSSVSLNVYEDDTLLQSSPDFYGVSMQEGYQTPVSFPDFIPPETNKVYRLEFSITSVEDVIDDDLSNNTIIFYVNTWTGDKQNVLLEIATGTWCQYCPGAAMAADQFVDFGYNVAVIENHQGTGTTTDPFENIYSAGRNTYYGVTGFPTAFFDGVVSVIGGATTNMIGYYMPKYNQRSLVRTPLLMDIFGETQERGTYNTFVRINKLAAMANPNTVLHYTVTESNITFSWQNQSHLNFVNRLMLPGLEGTPVALNTMDNGEYDIPFTLTTNPAWNEANLEIVAFIQDLDTMEVIQAQKVMLANLSMPIVANEDLVNSATVALGKIYPNPFAQEANIEFSLKNSSPATIQIYNVKGQLVRTLMQESKGAGIHNLKWTGTDAQGQKVASGIYYIRLNQDGVTQTKKIMHLK